MLLRDTPVFSEIVCRPAAIASEGSDGVDASLNIPSWPFVSKTKSVNVPPVSTPTRQVVGAGGRRRFLFIPDLSAYCRLSPAWDRCRRLRGVLMTFGPRSSQG